MTTTTIDPAITHMSMRERVIHYRLMTFHWFPYLTPYVYSLVLVERPGIGTMSVDKQGRMYFDPAFVATLTLEQGGYVVMHEAWHLVLRHCHRAKDIIGDNPTPRQRGRLNTAYDCVVWELMECIKEHAPVIKGGSIVTFPLLKAKYPKLQRNMLPAVIYSIMLEQDEAEEKKAAEKREQERKKREEQARQQTRQDNDEDEFDPKPVPGEDDEQEESWVLESGEGDESWVLKTGSEAAEDDPADDDVDGPEESDCDDGDDEECGGDGDGPDGPVKKKKVKGKQGVAVDASDKSGSDQDGDDTPTEGTDGGGEATPHDQWEDMTPVGGGSCSDGMSRDYEEEPNDNWDSYIEDELLNRVEKEIDKADQPWSPGRGNVPGCLRETISNKLRPQPNPWDKLRAACGLAAANPRGRPDFTYQRPNRRQAAMPSGLILKGQRKYSPKAVVILDSSGSMTQQCKVKCLTVVAQGLKAVGDFRVIVGDTMVRLDERFTSMPSSFEFKGGGGTCMVTLIKYAEAKYHPDLIVLGTDCGTGWPDKATKAQLIVAATIDGYVPKWATKVLIPDEGKK